MQQESFGLKHFVESLYSSNPGKEARIVQSAGLEEHQV